MLNRERRIRPGSRSSISRDQRACKRVKYRFERPVFARTYPVECIKFAGENALNHRSCRNRRNEPA